MKTFIYLLFILCSFLNSCAQQRFEKPPKPGKGKVYKNILPSKRKMSYYFSSGALKKNSDSLYCWQIDHECHIIDGKTKLFTYYQTSGDDNPMLVPYDYAEGEFLEGKYQGIWKYYDEKRKVIKKEKWDNGKLIYRKEFK
ncbi:hypothetical protein [Chryseobacterium sp. OV279]|uniref:hypothetical protein n=1 Tax=Chryseobacterium sp. OV279 TaxID=1500285 RepID=UPI000918E92C|nr:hypothetical protein [Chryseobacterium sp. OV279]SHF00379.1 hypothetical protein SAMN02787100_1329 [Chryseobacterium sp. OV279]